MDFKIITPHESVSLFVKSIIVFENSDVTKKTTLPFYADGYPGIMFQMAENGLMVMPQNKKMPELFLYGQTIHPIELKLEGVYKLIVFQLYPFVINSFFDVQPQQLNDDCYDLLQLQSFKVSELIKELHQQPVFEKWNHLITTFLFTVFENKKQHIDSTIQKAIQLIIKNNGLQTIKALREQLHIAERAFERRFIAQVGVTPKQFSQIIKFQLSLTDITGNDYNKLTDVVYKNGFADQSHFIRVFKAFTGKTPKTFSNKTA